MKELRLENWIEECRRQGVATALIQERETIAKQYGYSKIYVSIDPVESSEMISLEKNFITSPYKNSLILFLHFTMIRMGKLMKSNTPGWIL